MSEVAERSLMAIHHNDLSSPLLGHKTEHTRSAPESDIKRRASPGQPHKIDGERPWVATTFAGGLMPERETMLPATNAEKMAGKMTHGIAFP